jgi:dihydrolipoamide dehydrogenase
MAELDVVVIGAGPGGYVAAIRAAQLGLKVACVEKEPALGGTCLRVGCIPSKALLEASEQYHRARHSLKRFGVKVGDVELDLDGMMKHKDSVVDANTKGVAFLFKKHRIERVKGLARLVSAHTVEVTEDGGKRRTLHTRHVILATGSVPSSLPGLQLDGDRIGTSTEALAYDRVPETLIVIGAGYIGLEMGSVWSRLGTKVTVLEYLPRILPGMDSELAKEARKLLERQGLDIKTGCKVKGAQAEKDHAVVEYEDTDGKSQRLGAERVLVAVGRRPFTDDLGLDELGIERDDKGRIVVDEQLRTGVDGVWALGDVIRGPMLAHKASEEGVAVAERIAGGYGHVNYDAIPGVVYTEPEIASVGKTEEELQQAGVPYVKGRFLFRANGRARALAATDGFVKVLRHEQTDRILGVHIVGPRAGDLIAEAALAIELMATAEDVGRTPHAHPTLAEALKEAMLDAEGWVIHS